MSLDKIVLKSTTTISLSDRFTEIMKRKSPKSGSTQQIRVKQTQMAQGSARNKRLAEQMSRRKGLDDDTPKVQPANVKSRLGAVSTKSRLGVVPNVNRGGGQRVGRGLSSSRIGAPRWSNQRGGPRGRGGSGSRGSSRNARGNYSGGRGSNRGSGGNDRGARRNSQGRGRGGGRGRGRGGATSKVSKADLDSELDSYMKVGKKDY